MRTWPNLPLLELMGRGASVEGFGGAGPVQVGGGLDGFGGGADFGDDDRAEDCGGEMAEDVGELGRGEGDDGGGAEGFGASLLGGVGVPAAGEVDGEDGGGDEGEGVAEEGCGAAQGGLEAGADDGIDEEVGFGEEFGEVFGGDVLAGVLRRLHRRWLRGGGSGLSAASPLSSDAGRSEEDADAYTFTGEDAGGGEAIAAVVAFAAEDEDVGGLGVVAQGEGGYGLAGGLHEVSAAGCRGRRCGGRWRPFRRRSGFSLGARALDAASRTHVSARDMGHPKAAEADLPPWRRTMTSAWRRG